VKTSATYITFIRPVTSVTIRWLSIICRRKSRELNLAYKHSTRLTDWLLSITRIYKKFLD